MQYPFHCGEKYCGLVYNFQDRDSPKIWLESSHFLFLTHKASSSPRNLVCYLAPFIKQKFRVHSLQWMQQYTWSKLVWYMNSKARSVVWVVWLVCTITRHRLDRLSPSRISIHFIFNYIRSMLCYTFPHLVLLSFSNTFCLACGIPEYFIYILCSVLYICVCERTSSITFATFTRYFCVLV